MSLTPQMLVHRDEAERLLDCCYKALEKHGAGSIQHTQANAAYDAHAAKADPGWHCCVTDPDLWSMFSDLHKDAHGFRPRGGHWTAAEVRDDLDYLELLIEKQTKDNKETDHAH